MERPLRTSERLTALFAAGLVLFHPMIIGIFDLGPATTMFGVPLLVFYCFAAWGGLIALMAVIVEKRGSWAETGHDSFPDEAGE